MRQLQCILPSCKILCILPSSTEEICIIIPQLNLKLHIICFLLSVCVMQRLPSVDFLSDDDDGQPPVSKLSPKRPSGKIVRQPSSTWASIDDLSDDSSSHGHDLKEVGLPRRRKRKRKGDTSSRLTPRQRLVSDAHCKATLGKMCTGCKRPCLAIFQSGQRLTNFQEFREVWSETHKLDQDKIVPRRRGTLLARPPIQPKCCWFKQGSKQRRPVL